MSDDTAPSDLATLLSAERLGPYQQRAHERGHATLDLYLAGAELASSFHRDLGIVEVVLRNAMNDQLARRYGPRWWADPNLLDHRGQQAIIKAWKDSRSDDTTPPGRIIAQLPMGFWIQLLDLGGYSGERPYRQRRYYDATMWRAALRFAFPYSPQIREQVHGLARNVYALRNRVAHCEPVINGVRVPGTKIHRSPAAIHHEIITLVAWISDPVGRWLASRSHTPALLARL